MIDPRVRGMGIVASLVLGLAAPARAADKAPPPRAVAAPVKNAGLAKSGDPKYAPDFKAFAYANPEAPKGGTLVLGTEGSFDSLNPFAVKDDAPLQVGDLVFQTLGEQALDEPFSKYPALAESFAIAPDQLSMTIKLRPEARFSDGKPVTAGDVVFSYKTFQTDKVPPFYKFYWADIKSVKAVDKHTVKVTFKQVNPELALITTDLPILPQHIYGKGDFARDFATKAVGSGPYVVKDYKVGSYITLVRNPKFWGKDLALYKGRDNFDQITVKFYKDPTAMLEGFKRGDFDVFNVMSSKVWANDLTGDKIDKLHWIKKELWANENDQGAQGFYLNLREPRFKDVRVREALALAFDFDWSNKNLFYGQYKEGTSFFENSPLKATGLPSAGELALLEPFKADLPPEVFTKEIGYLGKGMSINARLREAMHLLQAAGFKVKDGVAQDAQGNKLEFNLTYWEPPFTRVIEPYIQNLHKLGVIVKADQKERSVFIKRIENRAFDMAVLTVAESQSPGNEQRDFWSSKAADQGYSSNYSGVKNKAVDALVDKIIYAKSRAELETATHALDRVLYHLHIMVPQWYLSTHRVAYWNKFARPAQLPLFYQPRQEFEFMWLDQAKARALQQAKAKDAPLP